MVLESMLDKLGLTSLQGQPDELEQELTQRIVALRATMPSGEQLSQQRQREQEATGTWSMSAVELELRDLQTALLALTLPKRMAERIRQEEAGEIPPTP